MSGAEQHSEHTAEAVQDCAREAFGRAYPGRIYLGPQIAIAELTEELLALRRHTAALEHGGRIRLHLPTEVAGV